MAQSDSFLLLDERIQRFLWTEGWEELRDAQEAAIPIIVNGTKDVIIAAATAAGKTEAAFLPALTLLLQQKSLGLIVCISPLKALINDQLGRLERLCEQLDVPTWSWHGDVTPSLKARFLAKRNGVLLITPESLEAILCHRGSSVASLFHHVIFFVIDELHVFIGSERGKQVQSLMHRIETCINRRVPRIGLSATLGDMRLAADYLRPEDGNSVSLVESRAAHSEIKILLKGFEEPLVIREKAKEEEEEEVEEKELEPKAPALIASQLFSALRGSNNLVFPNSRSQVENYTYLLSGLCEERRVPNEFWPHHGSLSKEIRSETERALKQRDKPSTAICTNTLELGIDIGAVKSIVQLGPPPSVASLRQRLGRSGRRKGEPAILRGYCVENSLSGTASLDTELRLQTIQFIAMIELLLEGWFEPPVANSMHLSTLVQQILSFIAQNGGATVGRLFSLFCSPSGPFPGVNKDDFAELLRSLGGKDLLVQDSDGTLLHGVLGEKFVNQYKFYATFSVPDEYRIVCGGRVLGTLPISHMLVVGQRILFAGRTWLIEAIEEQQKTIVVVRTRGGKPPLFSGGGGRVHTRVRQRMRQLFESTATPAYVDKAAATLVAQGRSNYAQRNLASCNVLDLGKQLLLLTWLGDNANEALACLFRQRGLNAAPGGPGVEIQKRHDSSDDVLNLLRSVAEESSWDLDSLLPDTANLQREKWDWTLPDQLLRKSYASCYLNLEEARAWARSVSGYAI